MKQLRILYGLALTGLFTLYFGTLVILRSLFGASVRQTYPYARRWARAQLRANRVQVRLERAEGVDWDSPMVLLSNHRSHYDVVAMLASLPVALSFVTKQELRRLPVFGRGVESLGMIFIDRKNRERALASLERAARQVREGRVVTFFAEGTRSDDGRTMRAFKKGGFHLARSAGVPVLPLVVLGSEKVLPKHSLLISPGTITLRFGAPLYPEPDETVEDLMARTRQVMEELMAGE